MKKTPQLQKAIDHVQSVFPTLDIVIFSKDGRWQYMDEDFNGFAFDERIDTSILEEASDSIEVLPAIFHV